MSKETTADTDRTSPSEPRPLSPPQRIVEWLATRNMFATMGGFGVVGLVAARLGAPAPLVILVFLAGGVFPLVLAMVSTREDGYDQTVSIWMQMKFLVSQLAWAVTPWGLLTQALQLGGTAAAYLRHGGQLPSRNRQVPTTVLTAPFDGEWTTVNGGVTKPTSHSWGIVSQRYAYDFLITDDHGETYEGDGNRLTDYYAFGEPIRAPADGTAVETNGGFRDYPRPGSGWLEWRTWNIAGNHVVIKHADGEYSTLAHLKEGSIQVAPGDEVERGEVIGECGNSGLSSEPHLHFQLQDYRNFWFAAGLVPRFEGVTIDRSDERRASHEVYEACEGVAEGRYLWAGDRITSACEVQTEG